MAFSVVTDDLQSAIKGSAATSALCSTHSFFFSHPLLYLLLSSFCNIIQSPFYPSPPNYHVPAASSHNFTHIKFIVSTPGSHMDSFFILGLLLNHNITYYKYKKHLCDANIQQSLL